MHASNARLTGVACTVGVAGVVGVARAGGVVAPRTAVRVGAAALEAAGVLRGSSIDFFRTEKWPQSLAKKRPKVKNRSNLAICDFSQQRIFTRSADLKIAASAIYRSKWQH